MRTTATVEIQWQSVLGWLVRTFREKGLTVRKSFDLQLARQSLRDNDEEPCPHHGTNRYTCQYLVLQIGRRGRTPSGIVIHGYDSTTKIVLLSAAGGKADEEDVTRIREAFEQLLSTGCARRIANGHADGDPRSLRNGAALGSGK